VLLPGMDGTGNLFTCLIAALPSSIETTILRYPTDRVQSQEQLLQFLEYSLPASDPFVLVAESFSTPLAIEWAAIGRTNLKGLVICAGFAASPVRGWLRLLGLLLSPICFLVRPPDIAIRSLLVGSGAPDSLVAAVRGAIGSVKPRKLAHCLRLTLTCDSLSALAEVRSPILLLQPTQDKILSSSCLGEMRDMKPKAAVEMIPGPHLILQASAQQSAEVIARYARQFWTT
jgi:pimeloyl-[acyl-carrier protein] methyl ester esterase